MKDENRGIYFTNYPNQGIFRKKNDITLGKKIMLKRDQAEEESGDCTDH